jgi:phenylacetate-CoA ligase
MSKFHRQIFDMFMESQFWPLDRMLEYQRGQLTQLLRHARASVPFYKSRLDPLFRKNGDIDWSRWHEIPIVKRHHLVEQAATMQAASVPDGHGPRSKVFSSGSSGVPITTMHSELARWVSEITVYRAQCWHGLDWQQNSVTWMGDDPDVAGWPDGKELGPWAPYWLDEDKRGKNFGINRFVPEEKVINFALRKQARYLAGRPKSLQALALAAERLNIVARFDKVTVFGAVVTADEREDFRRVFGAGVLSHYSSGEGYKIGISCETGSHYHINSEINFLEILDDDDRPCAIGQLGRVVITPFLNTAQPLIRYEQGDLAIRGEPCACGKTLPVLQEISGRITHLFQFPDGRKMAPSLPDREFSTGFGAKVWQLVQTAPLVVEVRFVQMDLKTKVNEQFARTMIRSKIHAKLAVKFTRLDKTPLTPSGKFIQYKSELQTKP